MVRAVFGVQLIDRKIGKDLIGLNDTIDHMVRQTVYIGMVSRCIGKIVMS